MPRWFEIVRRHEQYVIVDATTAETLDDNSGHSFPTRHKAAEAASRWLVKAKRQTEAAAKRATGWQDTPKA